MLTALWITHFSKYDYLLFWFTFTTCVQLQLMFTPLHTTTQPNGSSLHVPAVCLKEMLFCFSTIIAAGSFLYWYSCTCLVYLKYARGCTQMAKVKQEDLHSATGCLNITL
jgi:hypothetical protein